MDFKNTDKSLEGDGRYSIDYIPPVMDQRVLSGCDLKEDHKRNPDQNNFGNTVKCAKDSELSRNLVGTTNKLNMTNSASGSIPNHHSHPVVKLEALDLDSWRNGFLDGKGTNGDSSFEHDHTATYERTEFRMSDIVQRGYDTKTISLKIDTDLEEQDQETSCDECATLTNFKREKKKCGKCSQCFSNNTDIQMQTMHHKEYTCDVCGKYFHQFDQLKTHLKKHTNNVKASTLASVKRDDMKVKSQLFLKKCQFCDDEFKSENLLLKHTNSFHVGHSCDICRQSIPGKLMLNFHKLAHEHESRSGEFICDLCGEIFKTVVSFHTHLKIHEDKERPFRCDICGRGYVGYRMLKRHLRESLHTDQASQNKSPLFDNHTNSQAKNQKRKKLFKCGTCGGDFLNQCNLDKHRETHFSASLILPCSDTSDLSCDKCDKTFKTKSTLKNHIDNDHVTKHCTVCGEEFPKGKMKNHMTTHLEKQRCNVCGKYYSGIVGKTRHMQCRDGLVKKKEKNFSCEICDKTFLLKRGLVLHRKVHEKTYIKRQKKAPNNKQLLLQKCQLCGDEFQSQNVLKKHTNSFHVGHSCDICGQSIPGKLMLNFHKLAHEHESRSGEFICDLCGEIYKTVVSFHTHLKIHEDKERPFRCDICGRGYVGFRMLKRHLRESLHTDQATQNKSNLFDYHTNSQGKNQKRKKLFKCRTCGRGFLNQCNLDKHCETHFSASLILPCSDTSDLSCDKCDMTFKTKSTLKNHIDNEHVTKHCTVCGEEFPKGKMKNHMTTHLEKQRCNVCGKDYSGIVGKTRHMQCRYGLKREKNFSCEICDKKFLLKRGLVLHRKVHENTYIQQHLEAPNNKQPLLQKCQFCDDEFRSQNAHQKHNNSFHISLLCDICGKSISGKLMFDYHKLAHEHESKSSKFICDFCGEIYKTVVAFQAHLEIHEDKERPFRCDICGRGYVGYRMLKRHIRESLHTNQDKQGTSKFSCKVCNRKYSDSNLLEKHMNSHKESQNRQKLFKCETCNRDFLYQGNLDKHRETHFSASLILRCSDTSDLSCDKCDKTFKTKSTLKNHIDNEHVIKQCTVCGEEFPKGKMKNHMITHLEKQRCNVCGKDYSGIVGRTRHLQCRNWLVKKKEKKFSCEICGKLYMSQKSLYFHKKYHNNEKPRKPRVRKILQQAKFMKKCQFCDKIVTSENVLEKHMDSFHVAYPCGICAQYVTGRLMLDFHKLAHEHENKSCDFCCDLCGEIYKTVDSFRTHLEIHKDEDKTYICEICGKAYNGFRKLKRHIRETLHTDGNMQVTSKFSCVVCGKIFTENSLLKKHLKYHRNRKLLNCGTCGKEFVYQSALDRHLETHLGTSSTLKCDKCDRTFKKKHFLENHVQNEHVLKSCYICDKEFPKGKLKYHLATHQENQKCDVCGKICSGLRGIKQHMKFHHALNGEKNFSCRICGKKFLVQRCLNRHIDLHKTRFRCKICGHGFSVQQHLQRHLTGVHFKPEETCQISHSAFKSEHLPQTHMNYVHSIHSCETAHKTKAVTINECDKASLTEHAPKSHEDKFTQSSDLCDKEKRDMKHPSVTQQARQICDICDLYFSGTEELERHVESQHKYVMSEMQKSTTECYVCYRSFPSERSLQVHMRRHSTKASTEKCQLCESTFKSGNLLHKHINFFHTMHTCDICGQSIQGKRVLEYHKLAHEHENKSLDFHCDICGEIYKKADSFRTHLEIHKDEERPYVCEICGKMYVAFPMLARHFQLKDFHLDRMKDFSCDICGNDYAESRLLEKHKKSHERKKTLFQCEICGKGFTRQNSLDLHIKKHETIESSCDKCNKTFKSKFSLKNHIDNEHITKLCAICGEEFPKGKMKYHMTTHQEKQACGVCGKYYSRKGLEMHMKLHKRVLKKIKKFSCEICDNKYTSKIGLNNHKKIHEKSSKCNFCGQYFSRSHLQKHIKIHSRLSSVRCHLCDQTFRIESRLRKHMESFHDVHLCDICGESVMEKRLLAYHKLAHEYESQSHDFICNTCGAIYKTVHNFRTHIAIHKDENKPYMCEICGKAYTGFKVLQRHLQEKNFHKNVTSQEHSMFTCYKCGKSYRESNTLEKHVLEDHKKTSLFRCTKCGKGFSQQISLDRHLKIHTIVKCEECNKTYYTEYALKKHVANAHVKGPCDISSKSMIKGRLKRHKNTHEEKHQCDICGKYYHGVKSIKRHIKSHTKEIQRFTCRVCGKKYVSEENFRTHTRYHQRWTRCSICSRYFPWTFMLLKHMATHNKQKLAVKCEYCDKTFKTKGVLQNHIRTFHSPDYCA
ncbi:uncharacterized protein LOC117331418 [Pecten maximus]|uniref:uncharacterized protein LOC117331418 n=1 Tax=Pecten maximus TaxID=6579 RepID=UPI0014588423|nr:uncharacterized protein LOC117331418 [Pecten maximus]